MRCSVRFRDDNGVVGAAYLLKPTGADDNGSLGILTCRSGEGLTSTMCDTIVADYLARNQ